jgi:predicted O-methyltransferase YrrM
MGARHKPDAGEATLNADLRNSETARRISERIDRIYARGAIEGEDGRLHDLGVTSASRRRGAFIAGLVASERPRATLEIGMAWGLSTLFILQALLEAGQEFQPHVVIDPFEAGLFFNAARRSLRELGIENLVEFHAVPSELLLPQLVREQRRFDLAFIDGDHQFESVFTDLRFMNLLLKPGGMVIFDDANWDSVRLACRFAEHNFGYDEAAVFPSMSKRHWIGRNRLPSMRAYRKPLKDTAVAAGQIPFLYGFKPDRRIHCGDLRRKGLMALAAGDRAGARRHFLQALRLNPRHFKTYLRLMRTFMPAGLARTLSAETHRRIP